MAINTNTVTILQKLAKYAVPSVEETIEFSVKSIPHDIILKPNIAIGIYLQEAYNLYFYAQADKENLCSKGLDWQLVEELPKRIEFLRLMRPDGIRSATPKPLRQRSINCSI
jgi:hypothetical protein